MFAPPAGIDLSNSDRMYLESAVSQPTKEMMFLVPDAVNLETLTNDFVSFVCEGECWVFISLGELLKSRYFTNLKDIQSSRRH